MKFIHTSDWHIGRLFQNIALLDDQLYVLQQLKAYAIEYDVDAIIIAGDIFDRSVPPAEAVDALNNFLEQLTIELHIPVIMISGNHDSAKRLGFGAKHMQQAGLHILILMILPSLLLLNQALESLIFTAFPITIRLKYVKHLIVMLKPMTKLIPI